MYGQITYATERHKKKKVLTVCMENMGMFLSPIEVQESYLVYQYDYSVGITSIPFNKTLG